jgi:hypothetical protein
MAVFEPNYETKMKSNDRVFILEKMEGLDTKTTKGLIDNRLFTGENKLHAKLDPQTSHWFMQYDSGVIPQSLSGRFTSFGKLRDHVEGYYNKRNIKIKQIIE